MSAATEAAQPKATVRIGSPASVLAAIPPLLGFEPHASMVVIGTAPPRSTVKLTLRYDLPGPGDTAQAARLAQHTAGVLAAAGIKTAFAVGYGPGELVTPVAEAIREQLLEAGITVTDVLRAEDGRYWSYVCTSPECCPAEGTPFDPGAHPVAKALGAVPVLASREALAATVATVSGGEAESVQAATRRAEQRAGDLRRHAAVLGGPRAGRRALVSAGLAAVSDAIRRYRDGGQFAFHDDAAWLAHGLTSVQVRDDAWSRMDPEHLEAHLRLWTDLTRLAPPGYVSAPASLLAFTAWQSGNGALANVALDRALADNPRYSMAKLLRDAIDAGAPPSLARLPMTPEEVAQSYARTEDEENQECDEASSSDDEPDQDQDQRSSPGEKPGSDRDGGLPGAGAAPSDAEDIGCSDSPRQSGKPGPSA